MRFAIFGDIHSNLEALHAVLADAKEHHCTHFACLGDIVGYCVNPKECLDIVRELDCPVVKGNHDELVCMDTAPANVSGLARMGMAWTKARLNKDDLIWLNDLKFVRQVHDFTIVHATLDMPHTWCYVLNEIDAGASFHYQDTQLCFFGHTHIPRAYVRGYDVRTVERWQRIIIEAGRKYFINAGSVGQPRDGDWRSSYVIYHADENWVELRRVEYDIEQTKRKINEAL